MCVTFFNNFDIFFGYFQAKIQGSDYDAIIEKKVVEFVKNCNMLIISLETLGWPRDFWYFYNHL